MASSKKKKIVTVLQYLLFLILGFVLLWLSFRKLDMSEVWEDIKNANYIWMLIALVFAIISHIFRALRWNMLIESLNYKTRLSSTFFAVMVGYLANTAVPRMGELARCGVLSKKERIPFNSLFGTVISERLFDMVVLLVIIFFVIVFQLELLGSFMEKIFGPLFNKVFANLQSIVIFFAITIGIVLLFYFGWRLLRKKLKTIPLYYKIKEFISGIMKGVKTIMKLRQKWLFLFYTFMIWLFYALMAYIPVFMLPETSHLTFVDGLTILAIGSLGIVAPVPGGIGAYHFIVKTVLVEIFKISGTAAGSFAALTHAGQTILNVVVGAVSYFLLVFLSKHQKPLNEESRNNK